MEKVSIGSNGQWSLKKDDYAEVSSSPIPSPAGNNMMIQGAKDIISGKVPSSPKHAAMASATAEQASQTAFESDDIGDHENAGVAHELAAAHHEVAGNQEKAKYHRDLAEKHWDTSSKKPLPKYSDTSGRLIPA